MSQSPKVHNLADASEPGQSRRAPLADGDSVQKIDRVKSNNRYSVQHKRRTPPSPVNKKVNVRHSEHFGSTLCPQLNTPNPPPEPPQLAKTNNRYSVQYDRRAPPSPVDKKVNLRRSEHFDRTLCPQSNTPNPKPEIPQLAKSNNWHSAHYDRKYSPSPVDKVVDVQDSEQFDNTLCPQSNTPNPKNGTPKVAEHTVIEPEPDLGGEKAPEITSSRPFTPTVGALDIGSKKRERLVALDVLRGLTIILMITANYQNEDPFPQLEHAEWFGMTLADSIFPLFLFIMGCAIPFALHNTTYKSSTSIWVMVILKRSWILYLIGLFLNGFPFVQDGLMSVYRYTGVLQRLGICYLVNATIYLLCHSDNKWRSVRSLYMCLVYPLSCFVLWMGLTYGLPSPRGDCDFYTKLDPTYCSTQGMVDRAIWGQQHDYDQQEYDPEGVLSTITALINCWFGMMLGQYLLNHPITPQSNYACDSTVNYDHDDSHTKLLLFKRMGNFLLVSVLLMFLSYCLESWIPISKNLWTPSFVLITSGFSLALLSFLIYLVDIGPAWSLSTKPSRFIYNTLLKVGRNPLLIYILSEMLAAMLNVSIMRYPETDNSASPHTALDITYDEQSIWSLLFEYGFQTWLPNNLASLIFSQLFIWIIFVPLAWALDHKKWYFRV